MAATGFIMLAMMTLARLIVFLYFSGHGVSLMDMGDAFLLGLRFDLRLVSIVLLVMLILGRIPFTQPFRSRTHKRIWTFLLSLVLLMMIFMYVVDFAHFAYLNQRLNASVLNYLEDAAISMKMVWQSYPVIWLALLLVLSAVGSYFLFRFLASRYSKSRRRTGSKQRWFENALWAIMLGIFIFGSLSQYPLRWSDAFGLGNDYKANLALNPFESFFNTLKFRKHTYDPKKLSALYPVLQQYYDFNDPQNLSFARRVEGDSSVVAPNVVLIIAESFSAYKSSSFGNPLKTTPFFDSLANNGLLFTRTFTPAYGTARGVWAIITSNPDVEAPETASRNPAAVKQQTIINAFRPHDKFYFLGGSTSWANIRGLLQNNIDSLKIYEEKDFDLPKIDVWGISDKNLFLEANRILSKEKKPFFAIIQTADNHRPYTIPEEDLDEFRKITDVPLDSIRKAGFESLEEYNAFRYTDYCFNKFFDAASKEDYYDNTIFVIIGDHGIPGNAGDLFPEVYTGQRLTQHHVPMLYYAPGKISPARNSRIASQVDVLPTLAGLTKIPYTNSSLGRDLLNTEASKQFAFIFDMDNRQVSIIDSSFLFRHQMNSGFDEIFSMLGNAPVNQTDSVKARMEHLKLLSEAVYEAGKKTLSGAGDK